MTSQDADFSSNVLLILSWKLFDGFLSKSFSQYLYVVSSCTKSLRQICHLVFMNWTLGSVSSQFALAVHPRIHHKFHVFHVFNVAKCQISYFIIFTVCSELLEPISTIYCHLKIVWIRFSQFWSFAISFFFHRKRCQKCLKLLGLVRIH